MYEELGAPFRVGWARETGFGAKSLMRLQRAGMMVDAGRGRLRLVEGTPEAVATTAVGPTVALTGTTAAQWYGWPLLQPPGDALDVVVPPNRHPTPWPGTRIRRQPLSAEDVVRLRGVAVTRPMRTALGLALDLPLVEGLAVLDGACYLGGISESALRRELLRLGQPKPATLAKLVNGARASVYESLFYWLMNRARVPAPQCQLTIVRRDGVRVARADFGWPKRRLVVEIDGYKYHSDKAAFEADRRRQNALVNAQWRVLRFTPSDLLLRPDAVVAEVRIALTLPLPRSTRH